MYQSRLFETDPLPTARKSGKRKYLKNNVSEGVRELEKQNLQVQDF